MLNNRDGNNGEAQGSGTSIFDPVLCELVYSWFCPPGGVVLDQFAGGSVRGIVASKLGRKYIGVDLSAHQIKANRDQAKKICGDNQPVWHVGDSLKIDTLCPGVQADLVFSCPPYADLEVYSDDKQDLSTMPYTAFIKSYREIIKKSCALLKENRFACFVVGEVRDKKGAYYQFVPDTVKAFTDCGMRFYNEAILITCVGSLPIRVGKQFKSGRKLGKTHQNVLVFVKGDGKLATQACGDVVVYIPEETEAQSCPAQ
jgi:16S rRNA G966 N2-methylase RsmD